MFSPTVRGLFVACLACLALVLSTAPAEAQQEVTVSFDNRSDSTVQLYWLDGDKLKFYAEVKPGASTSQSTFSGHKWVLILIQGQKSFTITAPTKNIRYSISNNGLAA